MAKKRKTASRWDTAQAVDHDAIIQKVSVDLGDALIDGADLPTLVRVASTAAGFTTSLRQQFLRKYPAVARDLACQAGCAHCCRTQVLVTFPEIIWIVQHIKEHWPTAEQDAFATRVRELDDKTRGMTSAQRGATKLPCALLVNEECSIYSVRPLQCRGWHSFDVEQCRRSLETNTDIVEQHMTLKDIAADVQGGIAIGIDIVGYESLPLELTAALRLVLDEPTLIDRWMNRETNLCTTAKIKLNSAVFSVLDA